MHEGTEREAKERHGENWPGKHLWPNLPIKIKVAPVFFTCQLKLKLYCSLSININLFLQHGVPLMYQACGVSTRHVSLRECNIALTAVLFYALSLCVKYFTYHVTCELCRVHHQLESNVHNLTISRSTTFLGCCWQNASKLLPVRNFIWKKV